MWSGKCNREGSVVGAENGDISAVYVRGAGVWEWGDNLLN
jgi:hypothetical protein